MSRESFVFIIGFLVFFTTFLGIPDAWKEWILIVSGCIIMFLGYTLRRAAFLRSITHESGEQRSTAFVEKRHTFVEKRGVDLSVDILENK